MRPALLCLACLVAAAGPAAAAHPRVQLVLDPCVPTRGEEVRRVLAVELGALLDEEGPPDHDRTRVRVGCKGALIEIAVDDPITGKSLQREIDLGAAAPTGRGRLLGLAVVELVSASWSELVANPRPQVPPAGPPPSPESRASARAAVSGAPPLSRLRLLATGVGRGLFQGSGFTGGGGLRLARYHGKHLGWLVDVEGVHGSARVSLGRVSTDALSIGTAFLVHQRWARIGVHGGVGLRVGAARLAGVADAGTGASGGAMWGPWLGPLATIGVVGAPTPRLALELGVEAGYVVVPVGGLVGDRREVAVDGAFVAFQLGVGVFL